uniref:Calponin-homology (CH) domain-containing protein n=1 Tax=Astyanax mexicanus TaxID=7994 RepID=A0A3B1J6L3_ASTMX
MILKFRCCVNFSVLSSGYLILVLCLLSSAVEQEQVQKRTFTNWINAQLSKVKHVKSFKLVLM